MSPIVIDLATEFTNLDSRKLAEFDVAWVKKRENFKLPTLIFCSFFRNLSRTSIENHLSKKVGVTDHPRDLNLSKVKATATIPSYD